MKFDAGDRVAFHGGYDSKEYVGTVLLFDKNMGGMYLVECDEGQDFHGWYLFESNLTPMDNEQNEICILEDMSYDSLFEEAT